MAIAFVHQYLALSATATLLPTAVAGYTGCAASYTPRRQRLPLTTD